MASIKIRRNGAWVDLTNVKVRRSGAWVAPSTIRVRRSGAWVTVWTNALTASPASVVKEGVRGDTLSQTVTLNKTATGAWISGGGSIEVSGSGTSFTFNSSSVAGTASITRTGTYRFTATDGTGQFVDVPVSFTHEGTA